MILIPQRGMTDCGIACVAMVCETTYEAALRAIFDTKVPKDNLATVNHQLKKGIERLGWSTGVQDNRHCWDAALCFMRAILRVSIMTRNNWHWVAWDGAKQIVYDPYNGEVPFQSWVPFHRAPNSALPVFKKVAQG